MCKVSWKCYNTQHAPSDVCCRSCAAKQHPHESRAKKKSWEETGQKRASMHRKRDSFWRLISVSPLPSMLVRCLNRYSPQGRCPYASLNFPDAKLWEGFVEDSLGDKPVEDVFHVLLRWALSHVDLSLLSPILCGHTLLRRRCPYRPLSWKAPRCFPCRGSAVPSIRVVLPGMQKSTGLRRLHCPMSSFRLQVSTPAHDPSQELHGYALLIQERDFFFNCVHVVIPSCRV